MSENKQKSIFDEIEDETLVWKEEWQNMPEFIQEDLQPFQSIIVHFENREDMDTFSKLVEQKLTYKTKSIWFPQAEIGTYADKRYSDES